MKIVNKKSFLNIHRNVCKDINKFLSDFEGGKIDIDDIISIETIGHNIIVWFKTEE